VRHPSGHAYQADPPASLHVRPAATDLACRSRRLAGLGHARGHLCYRELASQAVSCRSRRQRPPLQSMTGSLASGVVVDIYDGPDTLITGTTPPAGRATGSRPGPGTTVSLDLQHFADPIFGHGRGHPDTPHSEFTDKHPCRSRRHQPPMLFTTERSAKPCLQLAPRTCVSLCQSGSDHPPANRCASQSR
jgi:hypothetical protein